MSSRRSASQESTGTKRSPDAVVERVLAIVAQHFQANRLQELLTVLSQTLVFIDTLDQQALAEIRTHYKLSQRPVYLKKGDSIQHPKLATLLDYRATVFDKLGETDKAISDARRAIDVEPYNSKGYIRLVKLYKAITVKRAYEVGLSGLKRIDHGITKYKITVNERNLAILKNIVSEMRSLLQKRKSEVLKESVAKKKQMRVTEMKDERTLDVSQILPFEVVEKIFAHLKTTEIIKLLSVSTQWYNLICKMSIFNRIQMKHQSSFRDLQNCYRILNGRKIQDLSIPSMRRSDELKILKLLLSDSSADIQHSLEISFLDINVKQILDQLAEKNKVSMLQKLSIRCVFEMNYEYELLRKLPNLRSLSMFPSGIIQSSGKAPRVSLDIFQNLESLQIVSDVKKSIIPFQQFFEWEETKFNNLKTLVFKNCNFVKLNQINQHFNFLNKFPNITKLVFENNTNYSFQQVFTNINEFNNLQFFQINEMSCAKNNMFTNFLNNQHILRNNIEFIFQNLIVLNLSHSSIQFNSLLKILQTTTNLQKLNIGRCPNLYFKSGRLDQTPDVFQFREFIKYVTPLRTLHLNESLNFNDYAITELINAIKECDGLPNLANLDLSSNLDISGYTLLELVKLRRLDTLAINEVAIKPETIKLMENRQYVKRVECRLNIPQGSYTSFT